MPVIFQNNPAEWIQEYFSALDFPFRTMREESMELYDSWWEWKDGYLVEVSHSNSKSGSNLTE
jgi:hypothetical protein